ncbi:MAG: DUF6262 family protein [Psychrobacter sp.]|jgi:cell division protein FtsB|uniref:DUF6262 family protein n=1 Tax=Psychrobacter TaxID=497 RepID=UPI0018689F48|nr:DUF6262 family protein [Psychrobacter sp. FME61]|tara:strand:+ start:2641 stop:3057 length:417 start_codon:yes stop_codon:yes gene_type:complete
MSNGKDKGQENLLAVKQWIADRDASGDYGEYERRGIVNRSALFAELNISRSSFGSNGQIRTLIEEADKRWFGEKEADTKAHKAARERSEKKVANTNAEISKLMDQIAKLKAENAQLKRENERYAAMRDVLLETGYQPR